MTNICVKYLQSLPIEEVTSRYKRLMSLVDFIKKFHKNDWNAAVIMNPAMMVREMNILFPLINNAEEIFYGHFYRMFRMNFEKKNVLPKNCATRSEQMTIGDPITTKGLKRMKHENEPFLVAFYGSLSYEERKEFEYEYRKIFSDSTFAVLRSFNDGQKFIENPFDLLHPNGKMMKRWNSDRWVDLYIDYQEEINDSVTSSDEEVEDSWEDYGYEIKDFRRKSEKEYFEHELINDEHHVDSVPLEEFSTLETPWYTISKRKNGYKVCPLRNKKLENTEGIKIVNIYGNELVVYTGRKVFKTRLSQEARKKFSREARNLSGRVANDISNRMKYARSVGEKTTMQQIRAVIENPTIFTSTIDDQEQDDIIDTYKLYSENPPDNASELVLFHDAREEQEIFEPESIFSDVKDYLFGSGSDSYELVNYNRIDHLKNSCAIVKGLFLNSSIYKYIRDVIHKMAVKVCEYTVDTEMAKKTKDFIIRIKEALKSVLYTFKFKVVTYIIQILQTISDNIISDYIVKGYNLIPENIVSIFTLVLVTLPWFFKGMPYLYKIMFMSLGVLCQFLKKGPAILTFITTLVALYMQKDKFSVQSSQEDVTELGTNLIGLGALIFAGSRGLDIPTDAKSIDAFLSRNAKLASATRVFKMGISQLSTVFMLALKLIYKHVYGMEYVDPDVVPEIEELDKEVMFLMSLEANLLIGKDPEINKRVQVTYFKYNELMRRYSKVPAATKRLNDMATPVFVMYNRLLDKNPKANNLRCEPVSVMFCGKSGVGKTSLVTRLSQDCLKICGKWNKETLFEGMIYSRSVDQEYWDGYTGQPICVFDDFGQKVDSVSNPNLEFSELIHAVNCFNYPLHSASLHEKANNPFVSSFIILTTNLMDQLKPKSIICPEAIQRRVHLRFDVEVIPEVRYDGKHLLSAEKLLAYRDKNGLPATDMSHYLFTYKGNVVDYNEVVKLVSFQYKSNKRVFEENMKGIIDIADVPLPEGVYQEVFERQAEDPKPGPSKFPKKELAEELSKQKEKLSVEDMQVNLDPFNIGKIKSKTNEIIAILEKIKDRSCDFSISPFINLPVIIDTFYENCDKEGNLYAGEKRFVIPRQMFRILSHDQQEKLIEKGIVPLWVLENPCYVRMDFSELTVDEIIKYNSLMHKDYSYYFLGKTERFIEQHMPHNTTLLQRVKNYVSPKWNKAVESMKESLKLVAFVLCIIGSLGAIYVITQQYKALNRPAHYEMECERCVYDDKEEDCICDKVKAFKEKVKKTPMSHECDGFCDKAILCTHRKQLFDLMFPEANISGSEGVEGIRKKRKQFNNECVIDKVKKKFSREAPLSKQANELTVKLHKNMRALYLIRGDSETYIGTVLLVKGRVGLINKHFVENIESLIENFPVDDVKISIRQHGMVSGPTYSYFKFVESLQRLSIKYNKEIYEREIGLFEGPYDMPLCADITKHFIKNLDLGKLSDVVGYRVSMPTLSKNENKFKFTVREGPLVSLEDVNLAGGPLSADQIYAKCIRYDISTEKGDCGSPVIINSDSFANKLLGIHFSGHQGVGAANIITYETIERYCRSQISGSPDTRLIKESVDPEFYPINGAYVVQGKIPEVIPTPLKTKLRTSEIFEEVIETKVMPSVLESPLERDGPMIKGILKYKDPNINLIEDIVDECVQEYSVHLNGNKNLEPYGFEKRVLTFEEACRGIPGTEYMSPLKRTTSAGYPYMLSATKGKQDFFGKDDWNFDSEECKQLHEDVKFAENLCRNNIIPDFYFVSTLKDEKRPIEKVLQKKTRVFAAAPLHYTILMRKYFLGFISYLTRNRIYNGIAVGSNPYSKDWKNLYECLQKFGKKNLIAGDFSSFDGTVNFYLFNRIVDIVNDFYNDNPQNQRVRRILWTSTAQSKQILGNIVFQLCKGQPSGTPLTAISNSIYANLAVRYCYHLMFDEVRSFRDNVFTIAYGDDNIIAVKNDIKNVLTPSKLALAFSAIGMTYTSETKGEQIDVFRSPEEVTFLKRGFRKEGTFVYAPLSLDSILEMTNWISNTLPPKQATKDNAQNAILELYFHTQDVFDKWAHKIKKVCQEKKIYVHVLPYEKGKEHIRSGDFTLLHGDSMPTALMFQKNLLQRPEPTQIEMDQNLKCQLQFINMHLVLTNQALFQTKLKTKLKKFLQTHKVEEIKNRVVFNVQENNVKHRVRVFIENVNYERQPHELNNYCKVEKKNHELHWYICAECKTDLIQPFQQFERQAVEAPQTQNHDHKMDKGFEDKTINSEAKIIEKTDTVEIITEGKVENYATKRDKLYSAVRNFLKPRSDNKHPIEAYLKRSYNVYSGNIDGDKFYTISVAKVLTHTPMFWEKVSGFYAMRANVRCKVLINTDPMTQGLLGLGFMPHDKFLWRPQNDRDFAIQYFSQLQHVRANINNTSEIELKIPFVGLTEYFRLHDKRELNQWGKFVLYWIVPPETGHTSPQVDVNVYMGFEDVDVFGQTSPDDGVFERQSILADLAGSVGSAIGFDAVSDLYDAFKQTMLPTFLRTTNQSIGNMVCAGGTSTAITMAADEKNKVIPYPMGPDDDEKMNIITECKQSSFLGYFTWESGNNQGKQIWRTNVKPTTIPDEDGTHMSISEYGCAFRVNSSSQLQDTMTLRNNTRLAYIANMFQYYRGTLLFHFTIVGTKFHAGKLRFTYQPVFYQTLDTAKERVYTTVVDIRDSQTFTIQIPFMSPQPWKFCNEEHDMGVLMVHIEQNLIHPDNVAKEVTVYCEISAGDDFELAVPRTLDDRPFVKHEVLNFEPYPEIEIGHKEKFERQSPSIHADYKVINIMGGSEEKCKFSDLASKVSIGEKIYSFCQLLVRYSWLANVKDAMHHAYFFRPFHAEIPVGAIEVPIQKEKLKSYAATALFINPSYFYRISRMFLFSRGSLRFLVGGENARITLQYFKDKYVSEYVNDYTYHYIRSKDPPNPDSVWTNSFIEQMPHNTTQMINGSTTRTIEVPFYNQITKMYNNFTHKTPTLTNECGDITSYYGLLDITVGDKDNVPMFVACGSDFHMGYRIPVPTTAVCSSMIEFVQVV